MERRKPNILVTGVPGVGKSTFAQQLAEELELEHIQVGRLVQLECLYSSWDPALQCSIFDEDKVRERLEEITSPGGKVIDFHSCFFMKTLQLDLIFVLRAETHVLFDRLEERKYSPEKIQENIQAEIFQINPCKTPKPAAAAVAAVSAAAADAAAADAAAADPYGAAGEGTAAAAAKEAHQQQQQQEDPAATAAGETTGRWLYT
ncbi:UPF0101 protein CGI-137, putative [Eimeria brunetti]|uniref:Adenylate kinase isoenzyme 6 homolog n=1 Tax=Eimeria brunetti TaxID=51314 RepID=U6LGU8_9EIME|nr:UPF0101 protein CGI-137, putative [Eimeria brunetti]